MKHFLFALMIATPALAGDDVEFARGLARDGQMDLAEEMCERILKDTSAKPDQRAAVALVRAEIAGRRAMEQETAAEARKWLVAAADIFEQFAKEHAAHAKADEARLEAGARLRQAAEIAAREREAGGKKDALAAEGLALVARAEGLLAALKESELAPWAALEDALASYLACRFREGPEREQALKVALDRFMNFELDHGLPPLLEEASLTWALVYRDLGRGRDALARADLAIALKEFFRQGARYALPDYERGLVLRGYGLKARLLVGARDAAGALAVCEEMLGTVPNAAQERAGVEALLEKAEALALLGKSREAVALARQLLAAAGDGTEIRRRMMAWGAGIDSAELLEMRADAALRAGDADGGLAYLRKAMVAAERAESRSEAARLLLRMAGECEEIAERIFEAATLYDAFLDVFADDPRAPAAAFRAARTWNRIAARAGASWEQERVRECLRMLTERWPKDPYAKEAHSLVAEALYEKGRFAEAAEAFGKVPADARHAAQAAVMIGQSLAQAAREEWAQKRPEVAKDLFRRAEDALRRFLEKPSDPPSLAAIARLHLAGLLLHESAPRPDEALATLEPVTSADSNLRRRALALRAQAHAAAGRLDDAAAAAQAMAREFPRTAAAAEACRDVARRCDAKAEELAGPAPSWGKVKPEAARKWNQAAALYAASIANSSAARVRSDGPELGDRLYHIGALVNGIDDTRCLSFDPPATQDVSIFAHSAAIHAAVLDAAGTAPPRAFLKLACARTLAGDWPGARAAYEQLFATTRSVGADGMLTAAALQGDPSLLASFEELAHIQVRLATGHERDAMFHASYAAFAQVVDKAKRGSAAWWRAKYGVFRILLDRGRQGDFDLARIGLADLRTNYPELDGGKLGVRDKLEELEKRVREKSPR